MANLRRLQLRTILETVLNLNWLKLPSCEHASWSLKPTGKTLETTKKPQVSGLFSLISLPKKRDHLLISGPQLVKLLTLALWKIASGNGSLLRGLVTQA